jgi:predicted DNA-binding antitoxin AbrB/MazE fold protein
MREEVEAVFENGVFRPNQSVDLPEGQHVVLAVRAMPTTNGDSCDPLGEWRRVYEGLSDAEVEDIERIALDRSHFIPERA